MSHLSSLMSQKDGDPRPILSVNVVRICRQHCGIERGGRDAMRSQTPTLNAHNHKRYVRLVYKSRIVLGIGKDRVTMGHHSTWSGVLP